MSSTLDDFFGPAGKCAKCGADCDGDRELCATCLAEAMEKPVASIDTRSNSDDEMEDQ